MFKRYFRLLVTVILVLLCTVTYAQDSVANKRPEMATAFRADGKIYVVIAVLVAILAGLFIYVAGLDRKISKIENKS
jgi:multisubunit Na+/H+ antiporter MnhB subunit